MSKPGNLVAYATIFIASTFWASTCIPQEVSPDDPRIQTGAIALASIFDRFKGKEFQIKRMFAKEMGGFAEGDSGPLNAEIHSSKNARFFEVRTVGPSEEKRSKISFEYLYHDTGQWLRAEHEEMEGVSIPTGVIGMHDWSKGRRANQPHLLFMGHIWCENGYVDLSSVETIRFASPSISGSVYSLSFDDGRKLSIRFDDNFEQPLTVEIARTVDGKKDSLQVRFCYSEEGFDHFEIGGVGGVEGRRCMGLFPHSFEPIPEPEGSLKFKRLKVKSGEEVKIIQSDEDDKFEYRYREGLFLPAIDESAINKINSLLPHSVSRNMADSLTADGYVVTNYLRGMSPGYHCGAYSFSACAALLGREISPADLISSRKLVGKFGASVADIKRVAKQHSLFAEEFRNADYTLLDRTMFPVMLHLGHQTQTDQTSHWVVFVGKTEGGKYLVLDLPDNEFAVDASVLQTNWDGTAVVVSDEPIEASLRIGCFGTFFFRNFVPCIVLVGLVMVSGRLCRTNKSTVVYQLMGLSAICITSTLFWLATSPLSFSQHSKALNLVTAKINYNTAPIVYLETEVDLALARQNECLFVDARLPDAYAHSHVREAVSLPPTAGFLQLSRFSDQHSKKRTIVVYCGDHTCTWAKQVASLLISVGYSDVRVFTPGFAAIQQFGKTSVKGSVLPNDEKNGI